MHGNHYEVWDGWNVVLVTHEILIHWGAPSAPLYYFQFPIEPTFQGE
jgi:hypothetical protein